MKKNTKKFAYVRNFLYLCIVIQKQTIINNLKFTIMKTIFELNFKTESGWYNLLYSSKRRAQLALLNEYYVGSTALNGEIVLESYVTSRVVF